MTPQRHDLTAEYIADGLLPTLDNGREVWVHPDDMTEGTRKVAEARLRARLSDEQGSSAPTVPPNVSASPHGRNNGVSSWRARVSWNVDSVELLSPWPPPKPGTHESDLQSEVDDGPCVDCGKRARWPHCRDHRGGDNEFAVAATWSRKNAR